MFNYNQGILMSIEGKNNSKQERDYKGKKYLEKSLNMSTTLTMETSSSFLLLPDKLITQNILKGEFSIFTNFLVT